MKFILESLYGFNSAERPTERKTIYDNCTFSVSDAFKEWRNLKGYLIANQASISAVKNVTETLQFIIQREGEFPIMVRLAHVPVVGAASTAAVERGVFCMNQTKNKHAALLSQESLMNSMVVAINGPKTLEEFRRRYALTVLHTWSDKATLRHVDVGETTSLSLYNSAPEKTKVMIRTGKTADGIGHGKKRNTVTGDSAGMASTSSDGDTPSWSFHNGRFGETSKTGSSHRFVSSEVHTNSTGMLMSTAASADEDRAADEADIFEGIMNAEPAAADELVVAEKENDVEEHEEEDLLFLKAMDAYETNAASVDECIYVAEKLLNDIPVMRNGPRR